MRNLLKLTVILSIVIAFNCNTFGQQQFGIKVSGGVSKITKSINEEGWGNPSTTPFMISGQVGFYYKLPVSEKSSLGAEVLLSQIEGKEKSDGYMTPDGFSVVAAEDNFYRQISYLSLPVYYGYTIKKLTINGGFQVSYAISSSGRLKSSGIWHGQPVSQESKWDDISIENIDFGLRVGIIYNLTKKLAVEGTYYYGLNNINNGDVTAWKLKVQQITFGIRYALGYKEDSK